MRAPKWSVGMERVAPGVYVDAAKALHIDGDELCLVAGFQPTLENVERLAEAARELFGPRVHVPPVDTKEEY